MARPWHSYSPRGFPRRSATVSNPLREPTTPPGRDHNTWSSGRRANHKYIRTACQDCPDLQTHTAHHREYVPTGGDRDCPE